MYNESKSEQKHYCHIKLFYVLFLYFNLEKRGLATHHAVAINRFNKNSYLLEKWVKCHIIDKAYFKTHKDSMLQNQLR